MPIIQDHYPAKKVAAILGWSRQRVYRKFKDHPEVMRDGKQIFIPESTLQETILQLRQRPAKPVRRGRPPGSKNKTTGTTPLERQQAES
jgi:hypothetical protein